ncbi:glycoside-pentoside-hexuronide (GPH):cation symporter [Propioniciclava sp.]|uniref:glycoside-pentoside-hexuronide (GPH):cation symporter n=1 Tax=Propioniciclava sp. TaxID=2038686 RepID=UPI0026220E8B|nr:glycoside-pentoside-hexuronide (GPH):cation symporter [Propioniciclava sp.]
MTSPSATAAERALARRNTWTFAVGTLGRDFVYTMVTMFLIVFLTEVLDLDDATMWWINGILLAARLFDAFTDIVMGGIVDNTRSRWGAYKPWIAFGIVAASVFAVLLFTDFGLRGPAFIAFFAVVYLCWGLSWTTNDIPYWSMLPALTLDPVEREKIGSITKVFATIGLFAAVASVIPVTAALGGTPPAWTTFMLVAVLATIAFQSITLFGVKEPHLARTQERTSLRELAAIVLRNDQLVVTSASMILFTTGYVTTTTFGVYFFKYAYRDEGMYTPFAIVLGVAQLLGFALFPLMRKALTRRQLFTTAIAMCVLGYVVFFFAPMNMIPIGIAGLLVFIANAIIVVLIMMAITDCIEYGQWRTGRRNTAVTFALQPFINKVAGALATAIVGATLILTGINAAATPADVTEGGLLGMRLMMMGFPMILIVLAYLVYLRWYRIDEAFHARIVADLTERGELGVV